MLAELSLEPGHQRGHGALYDALNCGKVQVSRLRWALAGVPLPAWDDGRIRLAVDVSTWLQPDAATSPGRSFCHCYGRGNNSAQMIPGWPYSLVAALEAGRTSWTRLLDAVRLGPDDDLAAVTAAQVRGVIERIIAAGHWHDGDPDILVIFNAGYEPARLAWLPRDLPVQVLGRPGTNRVLRQAPPPRRPARWARLCGTAASSSSAMTPPAPGRTCTPRRRPPGTGPQAGARRGRRAHKAMSAGTRTLGGRVASRRSLRRRFPHTAIPLPVTGAAVRHEGRWCLVHVHLPAVLTGHARSPLNARGTPVHAGLVHQHDRQARSARPGGGRRRTHSQASSSRCRTTAVVSHTSGYRVTTGARLG